jgi:hypothetical protein
MLVDVAGEDEGITGEDGKEGELQNKGRDSTAVTVVEVDLSTIADPIIKAPVYRVVHRLSWVGVKHTSIYGALRGLAESWGIRYLVIDATGVGAGLASFLDKALPGKVIPFVFNSSTKSKLGWDFLAVVETGRFKDYTDVDPPRAEFFLQLDYCQMQIQPGPNQVMKWGVQNGLRAPESGEMIHDDYILSAALVGLLDAQQWQILAAPLIIQSVDPLLQMDKEAY